MGGYDVDLPPDPPAPKKPSLLAEGELPCPSCGKPLAPGTVVCMACGYDMLSGGKARTAVGEEEMAPPVQPIVRDKGLGEKPAMIMGGVMLFLAVCLAWWFTKAETSFGIRLERSLLVVIESVTSVGTGLVAVWFASWLTQRPFGKVDLAAARLFVCIAAFLLVFNVSIPVPYVGWLMKVVAAMGIYWLSVWAFIGRDPKTTHLVALGHAVTTVIIFVQTWLWSGTFDAVVW
jgi:hypothetical protein